MLGLGFGMLGGITSTWLAFPIEAVRRKLQVQGVGGRYGFLPLCVNSLSKSLLLILQ